MLSEGMEATLRAPISMRELDQTVKEMAPGKTLGLDEVITEFFKTHRDLIKADYLCMINDAISANKLPPGVTRGLIALIHKNDTRSRLTNSRPITLLNVVYKVFVKVLQLRV